MAIYRVNFLVRLIDGTRVTSPFMVETTSPIGALTNALRKWDPPFSLGDADVYGINIREIRPRGSKQAGRDITRLMAENDGLRAATWEAVHWLESGRTDNAEGDAATASRLRAALSLGETEGHANA